MGVKGSRTEEAEEEQEVEEEASETMEAIDDVEAREEGRVSCDCCLRSFEDEAFLRGDGELLLAVLAVLLLLR